MRETIQQIKRSTEEIVMLTLSAAGAISVMPFAAIRFAAGEWMIGLIDVIIILGVGLIGLYGWLTRQVRVASIVLTLFFMSALVVIIYLLGTSVIYWTYPTMVAAFFLVKPREAVAINLLVMVLLIPAVVPAMARLEFIILLATMILNNVFAYVFATRMNEHREHLSFLAEQDPLTKIGNRRALTARLEDVIERQYTNPVTASLVVLDLDHFKNVNDTYGHAVGDKILVRVTELVNSKTRVTDDLYRYGGEEFVVIAMGAARDAANKLAEQLRVAVETSDLLPERPVTISLGVAELREGEGYDRWLHRADEALYEAKAAGRNRVCLAN
jgi:diguanylate cyclase (GGDEF)-like protein